MAKKKLVCAFCGKPIESDEKAHISEVTGETTCENCYEEEQLDLALEEEWI